MKRSIRFTLLSLLLFSALFADAQTGVGIGLYPTGTETGLGLRLNKDKRLCLDARAARALFNSGTGTSSFLTEVSGIYRIKLLEKVRFHMGIGFRGDWNLKAPHKMGGVIPIGCEAFPFPFQNAGLIFEVAPYYVTDDGTVWNAGVRTIAGFVFFFPTKAKTKAP